MTIRCILVPSSVADEGPSRLSAALGLARRLDAHLRLLFVRHDPEDIYRNLPDVIRAGGVTTGQIEDEGLRAAIDSKAAFTRFCAEAGIRGDGVFGTLDTVFGCWTEAIGDVEPIVALAGRVSDLIVVDRPPARNATAERILDAAVFSSGRPTLLTPPNPPDDPLRHVVIAWNGSLEAARLVGHALDLLRAAERVSIVTAQPDAACRPSGGDLEDYLMWHGIRARRHKAVDDPDSVGEALLDTATGLGATMLVMGAYTHSRLRQFLLGGVTRHMLDHSKIPLLMEH